MMQSSQIMKRQKTSKRKRTTTATTTIIPTATTTTTTTMPLDEIIFFHILPKLPASCLHRFNCVSKLWYNTIHDPKFIATHLTHGKSNPFLVALLSFQHTYLRFLRLEQEEEEEEGGGHHHASLDLRLVSAVSIIGYCNGLTCNRYPSHIQISNPSTRELLTFPRPTLSPLTTRICNTFTGIGFGFDPVMNQYKVIHISFNNNVYYEIWVYTLGTNLWRNITATCNYPPSRYPAALTPVCTSGAVYWMTSKYGKLLSFDLHLEKFQLVQCPKVFPRGPGLLWYGLFELQGCPSLLFRCNDNLIKDGVQLIIYTLTNHHHHRHLRAMHTEQEEQQLQASSSSSSSGGWIWVRNCIRLPFKPDTDMIRVVALSKQLYLQWNTKDGDFIWYNVKKKIIQKRLSGLEMSQQVLLVNHSENLLSLKTFVPSPSPSPSPSPGDEFKVKYVSSRKAKHESPTATSFCSDQLRHKREKKWRRGVTPCWFPIMFYSSRLD